MPVVCDLSRPMLATGKNKSAEKPSENPIQWVQSDAEQLGFADKSFRGIRHPEPVGSSPGTAGNTAGSDPRRKTGDHGIFHTEKPLDQGSLPLVFFQNHADLWQGDHR